MLHRHTLASTLLRHCGGALCVPPLAAHQHHHCNSNRSSSMALPTARDDPAPPTRAPLHVALLGDIMLGRMVDDAFTACAERKTAAFGDVLPFLQDALPRNSTVIAGNLECAITRCTQPMPKAFNFKLSPDNADALSQLGLHFASTANNHVLDFGQRGLQETHEVLDRLGIAHAGSGLQPGASAPAVVATRSGHRVAFLSYSDHYEAWGATPTQPGINFIDPASFDAALLRCQVAAARAAGVDLVVVLIHWGPNWRWQPDADLRRLGREFLAAGADVVFGTSPHHIQGVEVIEGKAIVYSGGAFLDDYSLSVDPSGFRNDLSTLTVATFEPAAAAAAAAAAGPGPGNGSSSGGQLQRVQDQPSTSLVLTDLTAYPIAISHHWRSEDSAPFAEAGGGNPPYFSQVDFASPGDCQWVAAKLRRLCSELGGSVAVQEPDSAWTGGSGPGQPKGLRLAWTGA